MVRVPEIAGLAKIMTLGAKKGEREILPSLSENTLSASTLPSENIMILPNRNHISLDATIQNAHAPSDLHTYLDILGEEVALENLAERHVDSVVGRRGAGFTFQPILDKLKFLLGEDEVHLLFLNMASRSKIMGVLRPAHLPCGESLGREMRSMACLWRGAASGRDAPLCRTWRSILATGKRSGPGTRTSWKIR